MNWNEETIVLCIIMAHEVIMWSILNEWPLVRSKMDIELIELSPK